MAKTDPKVQVIHPGSLLCLNTSHHPSIGPEGLEIGPDKPVILPQSLVEALPPAYGLVVLGPAPAAPAAPVTLSTPDSL